MEVEKVAEVLGTFRQHKNKLVKARLNSVAPLKRMGDKGGVFDKWLFYCSNIAKVVPKCR